MEQKGMILITIFAKKKEGREKENEVAKIVINSHTFLFHRFFVSYRRTYVPNKKHVVVVSSTLNSLENYLFYINNLY